MKNNKIFFSFILFLFLIIISNICMAKDLDRINKYYITVDPRKDGSLDMKYQIEWEVLDSTSEGPLEWVKIGIPNSKVDSIKATSSNIKSIKYFRDGGDYIRIDFKNAYYKGDIVEFSYSFHQKYMYNIKGEFAEYEFTPGWFKDIVVKDIKVLWNATDVYSASKGKKDSNDYYVWEDSLRKNKKMTIKVKYDVSSLNFSESKQIDSTMSSLNSIINFNSNTTNSVNLNDLTNSIDLNNLTNSAGNININGLIAIGTLGLVCTIVGSILAPFSYSSHRGYGYSYDRYRSSSHRSSCVSSCACVSRCACACACAGGGRAGCSKKDFYGVTIKTQKLNKVIKK